MLLPSIHQKMTLLNNNVFITTCQCRAISILLLLLHISSNVVSVSSSVSSISSKYNNNRKEHVTHQQQQPTVGAATNDVITSRRIPFKSLILSLPSLSSSSLILQSQDVKSRGAFFISQQQQQRLQSILLSCFKQRTTQQLTVFGQNHVSCKNLFLLRGGDSSSSNDEEEDDDEEIDTEEDDENENDDDDDDDYDEDDATDSTTNNSVVTKDDTTTTDNDNDTDLIVYDEPLYPSKYINMYASIFVMLVGRKYDIFSPFIVRIARYGFILYLLLFQLFLLYARIKVHINNDRTPITIDTTSSITNNPLASLVQSQLLGKSDDDNNDKDDSKTTTDNMTSGLLKSLASQFLISTTTIYEYDIKQIKSMQGSIVFNILLMWFLHFKMEQVQPILINTITGFVTLVYSPLFQIYILQRNLKRPYKTIQEDTTTDETTVIDDEEENDVNDTTSNNKETEKDVDTDDDDTSNDEEEKPIVSEVQEEEEEDNDNDNDDNDDDNDNED